MHKFFISKEKFSLEDVIIEGEDVKHIYKVLRLDVGEKVSINNCEGKEFLGEIVYIDKKVVKVNILEELAMNNESDIKVHLFQGLPKSSKMDLVVQKNTELGVSSITPILTERVIVKTELKEFNKLDRWNRIAQESSKQCKRTLIPKVNVPIDFNELLVNLKSMDLILVPYENKEDVGIKKIMPLIKKDNIKEVGIIIGPEGGFEEEEIKRLEEIGAYIITLGPRILRTETAGFTCLSLIMYELGDIGGIL